MKKRLQNIEIFILGAFLGKPLHTYDIKRLIDKIEISTTNWGGFSTTSVYSTIKKLAIKGLISEYSREKNSFHPDRIIYHITESGKGKVLEELESIFLNPRSELFTLEIACSLICLFEKEIILRIISQRKNILIELKENFKRLGKVNENRLPFTAHIVFFTNIKLLEGYIKSCDDMIDRITASKRFDYIPSRDLL